MSWQSKWQSLVKWLMPCRMSTFFATGYYGRSEYGWSLQCDRKGKVNSLVPVAHHGGWWTTATIVPNNIFDWSNMQALIAELFYVLCLYCVCGRTKSYNIHGLNNTVLNKYLKQEVSRYSCDPSFLSSQNIISVIKFFLQKFELIIQLHNQHYSNSSLKVLAFFCKDITPHILYCYILY